MNEEIKEIFKEWKQFLSWCYENNDKTVEIHRDKVKYIIDYITNLQQEIEKLNDDKRCMLVQLYKANDYRDKVKQENERLKEWKEDLLKENIELENIRKEAIEYIKNTTLFTEDYDYDYEENLVWKCATDDKGREDLLNILQGSEDK